METIHQYTIELDTSAENEWEFEDALDEIKYLTDRAPIGYYYIEGQGMGWTRASGFTVAKYDRLVDALSINGDYRLEINVDEGTPNHYSAVRYSHDEPTGASFTIRPATDEEIDEYA